MMQPEGFVDPKNANKVCKLQRSIYGLVLFLFIMLINVFLNLVIKRKKEGE